MWFVPSPSIAFILYTLTHAQYVSTVFLYIYYYVVLFYLQILPENTEVESIPAAGVVEEEIEELGVKSQLILLQERQDLAEKSGQIISLLDTPDKTTATVVVDEEEVEILPSFEEIRSIMGFSPVNNTSDPVPHDEDLLSWSLQTPSRPSRRSIYDPIKIN